MNPGRWHLIVTSNYSLDDCFGETDVAAIQRRLGVFRIMNSQDRVDHGDLDHEVLAGRDGEQDEINHNKRPNI
jgi:hypothetical protein